MSDETTTEAAASDGREASESGGLLTGCDPRPQLRGWAPGNYDNQCRYCGVVFTGDKRAQSCAPCAYSDKAS